MYARLVINLWETWIIEIAKGIGELFLHPLFYVGFILTYILGSMRVKQERKLFHVRVEDSMIEMKEYIVPSLVWGLILSVITGLLGLAVPFDFIVIVGIFMLLISVSMQIRFLSPAYTVGLAFLVIYILYVTGFEGILNNSYFLFEQAIYPSIAVLIGLLIITEGVLIRKRGAIQVSPSVEKGKRGLYIGTQTTKRVWLVPVLLFIPNGMLNVSGDFWPVFSFGGTDWSPILVPFFIGFSLKVKSNLMGNVAGRLGNHVAILGIIVLALAVAGKWYPIVSLAAAIVAILGREVIQFVYKNNENQSNAFFTSGKKGLMILGVLPESPAERMGLKAGERLTRVNGQQVYNSEQLYEALQINRAHCKLEVYDTNEQIRLVQNALYEGDHHELGILTVDSELKR
ncbi:PDZ domain-containing protein [Bacillus sp. E214]|uniref:PDZ domain-containing protein n=1 Tax=Bacillus sp. E214 TaxID=2587156 RepID=UPI00165264DF|nr:PDZ domain-containing protein [Bacillus sp. E214]